MYRRLVAALSIPLLLSGCQLTMGGSPPDLMIKGRVVSLDGTPVSGALVTTPSGQTKTDQAGWFQVKAKEDSQWLTVKHPNFISRTRSAVPRINTLVRLTPDDGQTIALHFTGDVMFGRRFYDPNEDGDTSDGILKLGASAEEHQALLRYVQPLLENADLTLVNLESPLIAEPYLNPTRQRPASFHSSKDYAFASSSLAAIALKQAGVDVVSLGNNHLYDALDRGVSDTLQAMRRAGFAKGVGYFGAGLSEEEAWKPAIWSLRQQSIAFLGCTTITGVQHPSSYVASNAQGKGGAASCDEKTIRASVLAAKAKYDVVVLMIHGGNEYQRESSEGVERMIQSARQAGATLIINHHPHVVGGFHWDGTTLVARTMGNFLFDQTVWPTFESYLLAVHLRNGKVIHAYTEPLLVEGYLPKGITGDRADFVARGAAGREAGPFVLENGAMELDVDDRSLHRETKVSVSADGKTGTIFRLDRGWWVTGFSGKGDFRLGRDLLWVGDFEDEVGDGKNQGGALWNFSGFDKFLGAQYAYDGNLGARIQRRNYNKSHVVLTPIHRILVESGSQLSIVGMVRSSVKNPASLLLSWYAYLKGASQAKQTKLLTVSADARWTPFRLDVTVPSHTIALGLYLRLQPPIGGIATADFDNIRILEWAAKNTSFSPLYNYVWVRGTGEFRVQKDFFLGDEQGSDRENFSPLKALDRSKE